MTIVVDVAANAESFTDITIENYGERRYCSGTANLPSAHGHFCLLEKKYFVHSSFLHG